MVFNENRILSSIKQNEPKLHMIMQANLIDIMMEKEVSLKTFILYISFIEYSERGKESNGSPWGIY